MKITCELLPRIGLEPVTSTVIDVPIFGGCSDNPFPASEFFSVVVTESGYIFASYRPLEANGEQGSWPDPEEELWRAAA